MPDDLSPEEQSALQRELRLAAGDRPWKGQGEVVTEPEDPDYEEPLDDTEPPPTEPPAVRAEVPVPLLDLRSGLGFWEGHYFTLKPDAVAAVLTICKDAIAEDLNVEIERLRGLLS